MSNYADMRSRIVDELANDGAITASQVNYAIKDSIKFYERRSWWFNVQMVTFYTTANGEYYVSTPPDTFEDIIEIQSMIITSSGVKSPLVSVVNSNIDDSQTGQVLGVPRYYSRTANKLRFCPIPNDSFRVDMTYVYKLAELTADADENAWTDEAEELIRQGAKRRIALNYFHAEDVAARCAGLEQEAYLGLMAENRRRLPTTKLRVPAMLQAHTFNINTGW